MMMMMMMMMMGRMLQICTRMQAFQLARQLGVTCAWVTFLRLQMELMPKSILVP